MQLPLQTSLALMSRLIDVVNLLIATFDFSKPIFFEKIFRKLGSSKF
jgi:hypothetical protein